MWMNDYEQCSGAGPPGRSASPPDSLCEAEQRESYAAQALQAAGGAQGAAAGALLTSLTTNGACNAVFPLTGSIKGYTNPFEKATGIVWERTDQGVDAAMTPGSPLLAFAPSKVDHDRPRLLRGPAGDRVRGHSRTARREMVVLVRADRADRQPGADGRGRAGGRDVRAVGHRHRDRLVGGRTAATRWDTRATQEGLATNAGADFRYLLQALGANPGTGVGLSSGTTMGNSYYPTGNPGPGP